MPAFIVMNFSVSLFKKQHSARSDSEPFSRNHEENGILKAFESMKIHFKL